MTAAVSQQPRTSVGALVQRAQEPKIPLTGPGTKYPIRESLTSTCLTEDMLYKHTQARLRERQGATVWEERSPQQEAGAILNCIFLGRGVPTSWVTLPLEVVSSFARVHKSVFCQGLRIGRCRSTTSCRRPHASAKGVLAIVRLHWSLAQAEAQ